MINEYQNKEEVQKEDPKKKKKSSRKPLGESSKTFMQIINGDFLTKDFVLNNLTYIVFIVMLLILIVGKGYYVNQLAKETSNMEKELNQMTSDYVENKAKLEEETRRQVLVDKLTPLGLKETRKPTKVVRIKKEERE
ncbi:hypothetical protein SAMN05216474_1753 [Lishizhenia tianjinensis]|uniref:Cell division protein FtsL n=1 Tax=Lishizhenia tianjinensis TaxID=477690 RepID=A0A1I6ZZD5_9FLAO|nr:FtsL-like putative cell division protein [Lishizhenia tianjinensis]SFT68007.1 hypothetical protein SAMN05216474_1753 [Lishizhenia tianjinensis]